MDAGLQNKIRESIQANLTTGILPAVTIVCMKIHEIHPGLIIRYYFNKLPHNDDYEKVKSISDSLRDSFHIEIPVEAELLYTQAPADVIHTQFLPGFEVIYSNGF